MNWRENWRIGLLVVFVLASVVVLFAPIGALGSDAGPDGGADNGTGAAGLTNLQYGLDLSGGTRVRAPLVGLTAEDVNVTQRNDGNVTRAVAEELGLTTGDVQAQPGNGSAGTVEVFSRNVTQQEFANALQAAGLDAQADDVRQGVTRATLDQAVQVLQNKLSASGLSGATVQTVSGSDRTFLLVEVPNQNRSEVLKRIGDQGRVQTVASFPVERPKPDYCQGPIGQGPDNATGGANATANGSTVTTTVNGGTVTTTANRSDATASQQGGTTLCNVTVLGNQTAFEDISPVTRDDRGSGPPVPVVPVTLTADAAPEFQEAMRRYGFAAEENASTCRFGQAPGHCLLTVRDGEVVYSAGVVGGQGGLAQSFRSGDFVKNPAYQTSATNFSEAQQLRIDLQAGALPAPLDVQGGTTQYILPSLASEFKTFSLVTGVIAVFAVAITVFIRYREPTVAAPMVVTALSEVIILLGFAAAVGLALDLSHIAGFIAVIGTGVDDLVIIADEILQNDVSTGRVFKSRFRKAFWVIGAAAATTVLAMAPLAVLSLGDLRGFAIVTIVGVLIGVLITRPAYGDVLRNLITED
jgi:preprotein translocase subunit SecD